MAARMLHSPSGLWRFLLAAVAPTVLVAFGSEPLAAQTPPTPYLLQMIRDDATHEELKLSEQQVLQTLEVLRPIDHRWWPSRILPVQEQTATVKQLEVDLLNQLRKFLQDDQIQRLRQLHRQAHGTRLLLLPDVAAALNLSADQVTRLKKTFAVTDENAKQFRQEVQTQKLDPAAIADRMNQLQRTEQTSLTEILSTEQQRKLTTVIGSPFEFKRVRRTYPLASEFSLEGSRWISEETSSMATLRGHVTVVFFYAFECINCQRNFEHYRSWHRELSAEGVRVIGIQTPETSAERQFDRVTTAYKQDQFEFPVLFDESSANWKAWGNTMWPTTYVIDQDGFIRRWWQGEMDWEDTDGHLQMRQTIVDLLAETSTTSR